MRHSATYGAGAIAALVVNLALVLPAQAQNASQQMMAGAGMFAIEAEGLYMTRQSKEFEFARDNATDERFFADVDRDWKPGARLTASVRTGPRSRVEVSGFFLKESNSTSSIGTPGVDRLDARFLGNAASYPGVNIDPTISANAINLFQDGQTMQISLSSQLWGGEANYRYRMESSVPNLQADILVGLRYAQLRDKLRMVSDDEGVPNDFLGFLRINARNHLYGAQVGMDLRYAVTDWLTVGLAGKGGLFANSAYRSRQFDRLLDAVANTGNEYYDTSASTELAALVEGGPSVMVKVHPAVSLFAGYQALWLKGVTLASSHYLGAGQIEQRSVLADSSLLYHGVRTGAAVRF